MGGLFGVPEAEAVMVLGGDQHALNARLFDGFAPLVGIKPFGVKEGGVLRPIPPFPAGKGVDPEMEKGGKL